jgi:enterobactin synthetase component D / holo-[acyl-carrier protein] synthase
VIDEILPAAVATAEARADAADAALLGGEEAVVARAVEKRRREFATGRACARRALERLGLPPAPIPSGERGEPLWPAEVVGSITHCDGYRAAAVARTAEMLALGIDAEPNQPLPDGLAGDIARAEELPRLAELAAAQPSVHWDRLLFCAKESVYKAWFPLAQRWLGFEDAVLSIDPRGAFSARLLVPGPFVEGIRIEGFEGRWLAREGLIITAIAVLAQEL